MDVKIDAWAWMDTRELSTVQLQALKYALTIKPRKVGDFPGPPPEPIKLYTERGYHIGVAREYFLQAHRQQHVMQLDVTSGAGLPSNFEFQGKLRAEQKEACELVTSMIYKGLPHLGGIMQAVPGWGKTVAACYLMGMLQVPTLVVVHKEFLATQWRERIKQFLPGAEVGLAQQSVCDFEGKHVVIGMVTSLAIKDYPPEFYEWPGLVIYDECHRVAAHTWSVVPARFRARYRIGFSATPRRKDDADNVFLYHLGPVLFRSKEKRLTPKVRRVWTTFRMVKTKRFNPTLAKKPLLLRFLVNNAKRNEAIIGQLLLAVEKDRKVIVLSERLVHLQKLAEMFEAHFDSKKEPVPMAGYYVGGMSAKARARSERAQVIFATSQYASEGLDIPALDTLMLTTPMSDVEQAVGRILRPFEGKKPPIVVDFRDDEVSLFRKMGQTRDRLYDRMAS